MELGLKNATVCISGGTKGMGYESALLFAREGARVCVTAREEGSLNQTVQDMKAAGSPDAFGISVELRDPKSIQAAYRQIGERWGELNTLVNMAGATGAPKHQHFAEFPDDDWYHSFDVGTLAAMRCAREALPWLRKAEWARIINVSSISARMNTAEMAPYGTSKSALLGLSKTMAQTLAPDQILVNTITPGTFVTGAFKTWMRDWGAEARGLDPNNLMHCHQWIKEDFNGTSNSWLGRCADQSELAPVVVFVGSKANSFMTGADINVDGGTHYLG